MGAAFIKCCQDNSGETKKSRRNPFIDVVGDDDSDSTESFSYSESEIYREHSRDTLLGAVIKEEEGGNDRANLDESMMGEIREGFREVKISGKDLFIAATYAVMDYKKQRRASVANRRGSDTSGTFEYFDE
mmetsp:Transcript_42642/g.72721  ORF Transcript_42642/g.72721 Transcript_42642/m.72721 type:complete len:131 (+) Transcript_42642:106-498(+)